MRRFCFLLCVSLLSSMFHAAAMVPSLAETTHPVAAQAHSNAPAPCHDEAAEHKAGPAQCDLGQHMCCVGLAVFTPQPVGLRAVLMGRLIHPYMAQLQVSQRADKLYKPPRPFVQIIDIV